MKLLYRSRDDAKLLGVCGGIGSYLDIDSNVIRIIVFILMAMSGFFVGFVLYFICALIIPKEAITSIEPYEQE